MFGWTEKVWRPMQVALTFQDAELGMPQAAWNAFIGSDTAYYPRVPSSVGQAIAKAKGQVTDKAFDAAAQDALTAALTGVKPTPIPDGANNDAATDRPAAQGAAKSEPETSLDSDAIMWLVGHQLRALQLDTQDAKTLGSLRERYRESLDEAKEQTEYQDQKAARLLTVISIFAAIGGVIFGKFVDYFPPKGSYESGEPLVVLSYLLFAAFLFSALTGAMVIFHASRTRYRWETSKSTLASKVVKSRLFYMPISKTRAEAWADAVKGYLPSSGSTKKPSVEIAADYLRDSVMEAYLVACKANDKVRYLRPAQDFLSMSTKLFLGWLVLAALTLALVPKWKESSPRPSTTSIQVTSQSSATISGPADSPKSASASGTQTAKP